MSVGRNNVVVRYSWIVGYDASMEPKEMSKSIWFNTLGAVVVATEDRTCTNRASVARGFFIKL